MRSLGINILIVVLVSASVLIFSFRTVPVFSPASNDIIAEASDTGVDGTYDGEEETEFC